MPPDDKRLRFYEAKRIFGKSVIHQVALVFAILFVVSVVGNIVALNRFETARRHHVLQVQGLLHRLYGELNLAASRNFTYGSEEEMMHCIVREVHWAHTRFTAEALDVAVWSLAAHHDYKYRPPTTSSILLISTLQHIIRFEDDPTIHLQILADKIYALLENLELTWELGMHDPQMPTQVLFDAMLETFREIEDAFGLGGRRLW